MSDTTNQSGSIKREIEEFLGLKRGEYDIKRRKDGTYIIQPNAWEKELQIHTIQSLDDESDFKIYLFRYYTLTFEHCVFECEIKLEETTINNKISFKNCIFRKPIYFISTTLNKGIIFQDSTFESIARFSEVTFNLKAEFSNCRFQKEVDFVDSTFYKEANFKQTIFKASAYFDYVTFKSDVIFKQGEFYKNAHFYQTKFSENPDFSQTTFNEHLNLTDTKVHNENSNIADMPIFNFDFEGLKGEVQTCSEADKFRDVFKNIKNALIKSGNLLGASRFRKMELYCKEIELDLKKKENRETSTRDFVDRIQLYCYRLTSDHHTDLLLILNNVIFLIALFGIMNLGLGFYTKNITVDCIILKIYSIEIWEACIATLLFVSISLYFMLDCCKSFKKIILHIKNSTFSDKFYMRTFLTLLFLMPLLSFALVVYVVFLTYPNLLWIFISFIFFNSIILISFVLFVRFNFLESLFDKKIIFIFSYFIVALMLIFKPSSILPVLGKLIDNKNGESCLFACGNFKLMYNGASPALETLNFLYMLLLFLLLFSLQKTARKNTIVPN